MGMERDLELLRVINSSISQLAMAVTNAIDETAYDLNAAAFSETTSLSSDYIFDSIELNFSTAEAKTITITSADGTVLWGGSVDQTAANQGYLSTAKNIYLEFNRGFVASENITVAVTQFSSAGTMDCILKTRSGTNTLLGSPVLGAGTNLFGIPYDFNLEVAKGNVAGHSCFEAMGERENVQVIATGEDIWRGSATALPIPDQTTGEQMTLVSDSAQDDTGGTGVSAVLINYLDVNWAEQTETVLLDGTNPVDTDATDIKFINDMHATAVDSNGVAVGDITIYKKGDATAIYDMVAIGGNMSLTINKMVPSGKTLHLQQWQCSSTAGKPIFIRIRSTDHHGVLYNGGSPVFHFKDTASVQDSVYVRDFKPPREIPSKSIIKVSAWGTTGNPGANIAASYEGVLVDN